MEQLKKHFTLEELTAIQSHDRHQTAKESVDEFAQELKKLFHKVYSNLTRRGIEAEAMDPCQPVCIWPTTRAEI